MTNTALSPAKPLDFPRGMAVLRDPLFNKGTAFTENERDALGLRGLLPAHVLSLQEQGARVLNNMRHLPDDLEKYVALNALHVTRRCFSTWCATTSTRFSHLSTRRQWDLPARDTATSFSGRVASSSAPKIADELRSYSAIGRIRRSSSW